MSASTDPGSEAARLAPPPPGTVVWSILSWPQLLADFGWLAGRWAPLDGRGSLLVGLRPGPSGDASTPQPAPVPPGPGSLAEANLDPAAGVQLATLHAFVIL